MIRTVRMPDLAEQLAEIAANPTAYVRRTREMQRHLIHHCRGCAADAKAAG